MNNPFFTDYTVIISITSFFVGAFIALRTYQVTKQKKDFEQANQIRNLLREFLTFSGGYMAEVGDLSLALSKKSNVKEIRYINHTPKLITAMDKYDLLNSPNRKIKKIIRKIYKVHRKNILVRNLYIYSLRDLIEKYSAVIGDYEKTIIYCTIIYIDFTDKKWNKLFITFYEYLRKNKDYNNQIRLAFNLIEEEIKHNMLESAENHLKEISKPEFLKQVKMAKPPTMFIIKKLELELKEKIDEKNQNTE